MEREIVFILEPDMGRTTVESSQAAEQISFAIKNYFGTGTSINCARPRSFSNDFEPPKSVESFDQHTKPNDTNKSDKFNLFHLYHNSTVDGPGRRSVIQFAGCSIRCQGCYVPETHEKTNGRIAVIDNIINEIDSHRDEHDGVTILGGEPFDQTDALEKLISKLKSKNYHVVLYTGYTLETLAARHSIAVTNILQNVDILIDGPYKREFAKNAGEYRGSSNQQMIRNPGTRIMLNE